MANKTLTKLDLSSLYQTELIRSWYSFNYVSLRFWFTGCKIGEKGIKALSEGLKVNEALHVLDLNCAS